MPFDYTGHARQMAQRLAEQERAEAAQREHPDRTDIALLDMMLDRRPPVEPWLAVDPRNGSVQGNAIRDLAAVRAAPPRPVFDPMWTEPPWDTLTDDDIREIVRLVWSMKIPPGGWREGGGNPVQRLREWRDEWVAVQQERVDYRWRDNPAVIRAAEAELEAVQERRAEQVEAQERALRRQAHADRLFAALVDAGTDPREAQALVLQQFPGTD